MKNKVLLFLPMMCLITACDIFGSGENGNNGGASSNKKQTPEDIMNQQTIKFNGTEKTREEFLEIAVNNQQVSPQTRGYNYCRVTYSNAMNMGNDMMNEVGHPTYKLEQFDNEEEWYWETDQKGTSSNYQDTSDNYLFGNPASWLRIIELENGENKTKFYASNDGFYMIFRDKSLGHTNYYYRSELRWNKHGDIVEADIFDSSGNDTIDYISRWTMSFEYSNKA